MLTKDELIALVLQREKSAPKPPEHDESEREHPMVEIQRQIRAKKLREFYAAMKRRPGY